ncbi:hypothetical protein ACHHYP_20473 [Achlya hypogyna]|uniref:Uncharacterized protein n=1 Tax=Achlya hypogyna TaxID=1202772 RepID=A0A1V9YLK5_ACHHY|nr:hypothetical protein ACHHYP_20473 [Achlya hypogyna]
MSTTLANVRVRLDAVFDNIPSDIIYTCSVAEVARIDKHLRDIKGIDEGSTIDRNAGGAIGDDPNDDIEPSGEKFDFSDVEFDDATIT